MLPTLVLVDAQQAAPARSVIFSAGPKPAHVPHDSSSEPRKPSWVLARRLPSGVSSPIS